MASVTEQGTFLPDNLIGGDKKLVTEEVLVASGQTLVRGSVLGRVKVSVPTTGTADGGNTGDGTCTAVSGGADTKQGTYTVKCTRAETNGGEFSVTGPDGAFIGSVLITAGAGGTGVFVSSQINFTLTDGATDFALADLFTIAVTEGVPNTGTADGGNTGDGTCTAVEGRRSLKVGVYTFTCITAVANGGVFSVIDPDSIALPNAVVGTAYESDQIAFLLNDGATDFVVGDIFTVTTTISPRQVLLIDKTATDGSSAPYGILAEDIDASASAEKAIAYLEGQFNERQLTFASGTDIEDVRDEARDLGMIFVPSIAAGSVDG
jgi:hypothetical protein